MEKRRPYLTIGILLLLAALAAGAYWLWSNPLFGRRLNLASLNPLQTQASSQAEAASGQALAGADAAAADANQPATDADIQAQLAEEAPEMAALLQAQESARAEGKESLSQTPSAAEQTACSSVGALSALVLGIDENEQADAIRLMRLDFDQGTHLGRIHPARFLGARGGYERTRHRIRPHQRHLRLRRIL